MSDLRLDFERLADARDRLASVISEFEGARSIHAGLPDATGHFRLQFAVTDFRYAWSVRREQLTEEITAVRDAVVAIHDTFRALDTELANRVDVFTQSANEAGE